MEELVRFEQLRLEAFAEAVRIALLHQHYLSSDIPLIEYSVCGLPNP